MFDRLISRQGLALIVAVGVLAAGSCQAATPQHDKPVVTSASDADVAEVQRAISEQRYVDAGLMLDKAALAGVVDPRFTLLNGQLDLNRGRFSDALAQFKLAESAPATRAGALEGEGVALSLLGRSDEAMAALQKAVAQAPSAWRAWDALGSEYDRQGAWSQAEAAYDKALKGSGGAAIVLNNRGYSRLLQHRFDDAAADLVAALQKKPDLAEARTNLRLALGLKGDYVRAAEGGAQEDRAALLNNAGFAAALRGDYAQAEDLLNQAIKARSAYYERASENLTIVRALAAKDKAPSHDAH